jgi:RND family efflux transporter MFP subunit
MHPQIRSNKPGKCPICGMKLVPVQTKTTGGLRTLTVSPEARALMNVETVPVERKYVETEVRMVGKVDFDETKLGYITAWVSGRLDQLYVDFTGVEVNEGDHMVYIYSEQLYAAQEELLQAKKYASNSTANTVRRGIGNIDLVESAREKLRLLGLKQEQIDRIEKENRPSSHLTIYSPVSGVVIEKLKQEGERVRLGERIYTVADLSLLWVHLDAYEADLPWIRYGQEVTITTEAYPGEEFQGRIAFIQPVLNDKTRTVKVRVNVPNPDGRLKPEMFVHAIVRPQVARGGRVMDPSLAGKWISPMHPEIVKDQPGVCDICGMPLVQAESLGYVSASTDELAPPMVIPYSAALVTGTRAVVYVELPAAPSGLDAAFKAVITVVKAGNAPNIRKAFENFSRFLDKPYDQPATDYSKNLWNDFADRLSQNSLRGQRAQLVEDAQQVLASLQGTMNDSSEHFSPATETAFEGREIVLGTRAGDYYVVKHGLQEGELVAAKGNFKIDAEIQIQAKPSMMTPEGGGGGGGHNHGGSGTKKSGDEDNTTMSMTLPVDFVTQIESLSAAYEQVTVAVEASDLRQINSMFDQFGSALSEVDKNLLSGSPRMLWKEFAMLLGNDVAEGRDVDQLRDADRVYVMLKSHMRQLRGKLGVFEKKQRTVEHIQVGAAFQSILAQLWRAYLPLQQALAEDDFAQATQEVAGFQKAYAAANDQSLPDRERTAWNKEKATMLKQLDAMQAAPDIESLRTAFAAFSDELGVLIKTFGSDQLGDVYELHCPMALDEQGAIWFQNQESTKNPYYGSAMLECSDRVELIFPAAPQGSDMKAHEGHSHNE